MGSNNVRVAKQQTPPAPTPVTNAPTIKDPIDILGGKKILIQNNQSGATIRYTLDGKTNPSTTTGTIYNKEIYDSWATMGVRAIAYASNMNPSPVVGRTFYNGKTGKPTLSKTDLPSGATITLDAPGNGETIFYTIDGSEPSYNIESQKGTGIKYTSAFTLTQNATVKAIALRSGETMSDKLVQEVTVVVPPKPTNVSTVVSGKPASKIAVDDAITVKWDEDKAAGSYTATLYNANGEAVETSSVKAGQAVFTPASAGKYSVGVKSVNSVGASEESDRVEFEAMAPCLVKFVDKTTDADGNATTKVLDKQVVRYGYSAETPAVPVKRGYTFAGWDRNTPLTNITVDGYEIEANWQIKTYTLKFYKKDGKSLFKTVSAEFGEKVTAPEPPAPEAGYVFSGWTVTEADADSARDIASVDSNMSLKAVYAWADQELPVVVSITSAKRNERVYTVDVNVTNNPTNATTAWLRVSLKTKTGKLVQSAKETISLPAAGATKNHTVTLKYEDGGYVATVAEVEVVGYAGDNRTGGAYSKAVTADVVSADDYELASSASEWATEKPAASDDYIIESEMQYRYRDKETTTSTSPSMDGWSREGDPVTTYGSWGGEQSTTSKPTASDTLTVTGQSTKYNYYHWHSKYDGINNHDSCWVNSTSVKHTISLDSPMPNGPKYYFADKGGKASQEYKYGSCPWSSNAYWWHESTVTTYKYKTRSKTTAYGYYKWNNWSDWASDPVTATDKREVEERTVYRTRAKMFNAVNGTEDVSGKTYTISGKFENGMQVAGKEATIMVYNVTNSDPNEDQIQYIGQTTIGADNSYSFSFIPKKEISSETGDYIVALGVKGSTGLVNVDKIEAPANEHKVVYLYKNAAGENVEVSTQQVADGAAAEVPDPPAVEGAQFQRWSASTTSVTNDMTVTALYTEATYAVAWVDWVNGGVFLETKAYGETLTAPVANPTAKGYTFKGWDALLDGKTEVTGNMVINAVYDPEKYTVMFVDYRGGVFSKQQVAYGQAAELPEGGPTAEGLEFVAWDTSAGTPWWNVTEDMIVKPLFAYEGTVTSPYSKAEIAEGYVSANGVKAFLETSTENAKIYYTTDGSDPSAVRDVSTQGSLETQGILVTQGSDEQIEQPVNTSKLYDPEKGITVTKPTKIRAIAVSEGMNDSSISEINVNVTATNDVANAEAGVSEAPFFYGEAVEPGVMVWIGEDLLTYDKDYTVEYVDNDAIGVAKAIIKGKGDYVGTQTVEFEIIEPPADQDEKVDLSDSTISGVTAKTYSDSELTQPDLKVSVDGKTLSLDTDYAVSYKDNVDAGTATVTVTGKGAYTGSKSATFRIAPAPISKATVSLASADLVYKGAASLPKPALSVKSGGRILKEGTDYAVSVAYNKGHDSKRYVGQATATVKGKGNYTGSKAARFKVTTVADDLAKAGAGLSEKTLAAIDKDKASVAQASSKTMETIAKPRTKQMTVNWKAVAGATNYIVGYKRSTDPEWSYVVTGGATTHTFGGMSEGNLMEFRVAVYDGAKFARGEWTQINCRFFREMVSLKATVGKGKVSLKWGKVAGATGYQILVATRKDMSDARVQAVSGGSTLSVAVTKCGSAKLKSGKTYYIKVRPVRSAANVNGKVNTYVGINSLVRTCKVK